MFVFNELLVGIANASTPENLLYAFMGSFVGTLVGVLPGLGPVSALAILIPFTTFLPPTGMIIALAAVYYGATYGGSTTSILMNVPGELSGVVTALDGYQMTKQGRPGPALAISAIVSFVAGIAGALAIAVAGPLVARAALGFGPAEYLGLGVFALTAVAAMSGKSLLKGIIVTVVGLILVSVGIDPASGIPRMTFGTVTLLAGLDLVPMMMGLFGVGEVLRSLQERTRQSSEYKLGKLMPNRRELRDGLRAGVRATVISFPLGLLPGTSPSIASFISYSVERYCSKHPEKFGKGAIEGVAAAEAANNAAAMGHLVPLLSLGVPAGASMALLLAAFHMYGILPGPTLFTQHAELVWTVIGSFFVANCILLVLNLPLVGLWARIATIPYPILAPLILAICVVGAYIMRNSLFDVWVLAVSGVVGWLMGKRGWPLAPMVLAYVLGPLIENSAKQVLVISPWLLLERPAFLAFILMGLVMIWLSRRLSAAEARVALAAELAQSHSSRDERC